MTITRWTTAPTVIIEGTPLFAFGHGLSYTKFDYSGARLNATNFHANGTVKVSFTVKNSGKRDGDEVAQVYFRHVHSAQPQAKLALCFEILFF